MSALVDLDALHYSSNSRSQYSQANSLLNDVQIGEQFSILDVGCGHGEILAELSKLAPSGRSVGLDPSESMIKFASETFSEHSYPNLEFVHKRAEDMNFEEESFDLIICTNAFMWMREPIKVVELMHKFLKKGGSIIIFTYNKDTPYVRMFEDVLHHHYPHYSDSSAVKTMLSINEHMNLFLSLDLRLETFDQENVVFQYIDKDEFKNYVLGWLSCYAYMPKELHEEFIERVTDLIPKYNISSSIFNIAIPHSTLSIRAFKDSL